MAFYHGKNFRPWLDLGGFVVFSHGKNFGPWLLRVCVGAETTLFHWFVCTPWPEAGSSLVLRYEEHNILASLLGRRKEKTEEAEEH